MESGEASTSPTNKKGQGADWRRLTKEELRDLIQSLTHQESETGAGSGNHTSKLARRKYLRSTVMV